MKIKIGKQQIAYLSSLDSPEAKKEFLLDHILLTLEDSLQKETREIPDPRYDIFKYGILKITSPISAKILESYPHLVKEEKLLKFDLPKYEPVKISEELKKEVVDEIVNNQESLRKEKLREITEPTHFKDSLENWIKDGIHVEEYGIRPVNNTKLLEELKHWESVKILDPNKIKKYTKEDLEKTFNESREKNPMKGVMSNTYFKHSNFADYIKTINPNN